VERRPHHDHRGVGHPPSGRDAPGQILADRAVRDLPTMSALVDRLRYDPPLRRLCGWCRVSGIPSESTLSRAFAWFAETRLPGRMHAAPVSRTLGLWLRVRREAGIKDVRLHDLRLNYASHTVMNGVPVPVVSRLLGHASARMTLRYVHLGDRDVRAAAERVGAAIARLMAGDGG